MKFTKTETVKRKIVSYKCDICGKNIRNRKNCCICGKHICKSCSYYDFPTGDYADIYCNVCWNIGESYRLKIVEIEEIADQKIDDLTNEWHHICKLKKEK